MPSVHSFISSLSVSITIIVFVGCASNRSITGFSSKLRSVSVIQNGLSLAVWLEDHCENREGDDRTVTMLEAFHDALIVPTEMLFAVGAITLVGTMWNLYDRFTLPLDESLPNRPEIVMRYVRPQRAGPQLDKRLGSTLPVIWHGCLTS